MSDTATPFQQPTSAMTPFQALRFFVLQRLLKVQTVTLVEIQAIHGGGLGPTGTVDVLPLVDQVDGAGNAVPHVTLYGRPYVRWQGGTNAFILDPVKGDTGVMVFGSRDLSSVIASGNHGPPPSSRTFNYADGLYIGCIPNAEPDNYYMFDTDGNIAVKTTGDYTLDVEGDYTATIDGTFKVTANSINLNGAIINSAGEVTDGAGKVLGTHIHPGVQSGSSDTGPPV